MSTRFVKEFNKLLKNLEKKVNGQVSIKSYDESNMNSFIIELSPMNGPYKHGKFLFQFQASEYYPDDPPEVICITDVYHPNIDPDLNSDHNICLNLFDEWNRTFGLEDCLQGLLFLMYHPNLSDPVSSYFSSHLEHEEFLKNVAKSLRGESVDGYCFSKNYGWIEFEESLLSNGHIENGDTDNGSDCPIPVTPPESNEGDKNSDCQESEVPIRSEYFRPANPTPDASSKQLFASTPTASRSESRMNHCAGVDEEGKQEEAAAILGTRPLSGNRRFNLDRLNLPETINKLENLSSCSSRSHSCQPSDLDSDLLSSDDEMCDLIANGLENDSDWLSKIMLYDSTHNSIERASVNSSLKSNRHRDLASSPSLSYASYTSLLDTFDLIRPRDFIVSRFRFNSSAHSDDSSCSMDDTSECTTSSGDSANIMHGAFHIGLLGSVYNFSTVGTRIKVVDSKHYPRLPVIYINDHLHFPTRTRQLLRHATRAFQQQVGQHPLPILDASWLLYVLVRYALLSPIL